MLNLCFYKNGVGINHFGVFYIKELDKFTKWACEIQSFAQSELEYSTNIYDIERFKRLRDISVEMIAEKADITIENAKSLFCNEKGYQTPKIDTRAAVFDGEFNENSETTERRYFSKSEPHDNLSEEKVNKEQIFMCFDAKDDKNWEVKFD